MRDSIPVAITGMGCICAAGGNLTQCMNGLYEGARAPTPPSLFTTNHAVRFPVFETDCRSFSLDPSLGPDDPSRTVLLALAAAREALEDAVIESDWKGLRVGVCIGTTVGNTLNDVDFYARYRDGKDPDTAAILRYLNTNPALAVARYFGLSGPCQTVANACSSGTDAIGIGAGWIRSNMCDVVLAGGADELTRVTYNGFASLMIMDEGPCKPFDRDRKGLNLGEGAAFLLLESNDVVTKRARRPRGYVRGFGSACDAYHFTAPSPDGTGLRKALTQAIEQSSVSLSDIGFINAHGTGTHDNDLTEAKIIREHLPGIPFLSTKGYTGHVLGATGAIEAAFTVACLEQGRVPASAGFITPDPELEVEPVISESAVQSPLAVSQSLAFGGHNAVLVLSASTDG